MIPAIPPERLADRRRFAAGAPLAFRQLTVQTTWACNARCAMCYQSSGPRGSDRLGAGSLSVGELGPVIDGALEVRTLQPRFHLVGGEAMLAFDDCLELVAAASRAGFLEISATTNAFWAQRPATATRRCERLRAAGLTRLEVSWDVWHLPWVSGTAVSNCLEAGARQGLPVTLRVLTSRAHGAEEALSQLRPAALDAADLVHATTVAGTGRAALELDPEDIVPRGELTEACHRELALTVNPSGAVFPCCSGLDQTDALRFGNVREQPLTEIVRAMERSALLRQIVFEGVASLAPLLEAEGVRLDGPYSSICSLCWSLFSREDCVAALRRHFPGEPFGPPMRARGRA